MSEQHIASAFDRDLEAIQASIMKMGGLVEAAIMDSTKSLETRDDELAEQVRRGDKAIDTLEEHINEEAARVIALRAPTAVDLRVILTVLKISTNLERIGGIVELRNEEGRGLTIILRVPMTLTIISGLMVRAAGQYFAIPRGAVREILLENSDSVRIDRVGGGELVTVRGEQFPLLRLETVLDCAVDADDDADERTDEHQRPAGGRLGLEADVASLGLLCEDGDHDVLE